MERNLNQEAASTPTGKIISSAAEDALEDIEDKSCRLVLTSPPYNIGKEYERDHRRSIDEYIEWLKPIIQQTAKKVSDNGSICWQTGNYVEGGEVFPLDYFFYSIFKDLGFKLKNRIIWHFNFGLNATSRFSGRYETLLWWSKSDAPVFNLDKVRVRQLYPGKRHPSTKGAKAGRLSGNSKGKNPSDFWTFEPEVGLKLQPIWDLPNVKANHPEKTFHPCQFPVELAERCILALTQPGDTVLDPFVGAGTSAVAAVINGRNAIGIDRDPRYAELARQRVALALDGDLSIRDFGKPTAHPRPGQQVAKVPEEWLEENEGLWTNAAEKEA
ncbi:site-specific DNA-methyltransferase [Alteraurantiacibacter aestuarii]|uniref:Methyltransferase n=1 Tax=Alteraurantiacibacter aestuarii TaxID=650004 RepID=A0A844ZJN1_9SPHN|nr:site-specific DNA-methyltransferase [Alteraurantiacibacter aestuarii]MXO87774.1 site-specific DNA-methyltransferase [Alteraurantiacibacter aestuarii]